MARNQLTYALRQVSLSCTRIEFNRQTLFTKLQGVNIGTEVPFLAATPVHYFNFKLTSFLLLSNISSRKRTPALATSLTILVGVCTLLRETKTSKKLH